jgi:hypothetical protein
VRAFIGDCDCLFIANYKSKTRIILWKYLSRLMDRLSNVVKRLPDSKLDELLDPDSRITRFERFSAVIRDLEGRLRVYPWRPGLDPPVFITPFLKVLSSLCS